jgi:rubrerythrin
MLATTPIDLSKVKKGDIEKEALRLAVIAELDAINLYEQLADMVGDKLLKEVFLDVAKEEKTHVGEFQAMLLRYDPEQERELVAGRKEIEEMAEKNK